MRNWHIAYLGLRELPADLTDFELAYFFSYSDAERAAIESRRGPLHKLASAIHIGFIKMTGRTLDAFEINYRLTLQQAQPPNDTTEWRAQRGRLESLVMLCHCSAPV